MLLFIVNLSCLELLLASAALSGPGPVIRVCGYGGRVRQGVTTTPCRARASARLAASGVSRRHWITVIRVA
jgi:hypothetical protein